MRRSTRALGRTAVLTAIALTVATLPGGTAQPAASAPAGTIAYVRGFKELRVINPDGSGDRRVWTNPDATPLLGINGTAWRPDGREIAFTSGHAATLSLYQSDLYAIRSDGTGFRRITNPPDPSQYGPFAKGTVSVTLRNTQPISQQAQASAGVFIVYLVGAPDAQQVTLPPGTSTTLTFSGVADLGNNPQAIVAMYGYHRWFIPGVDVQAGQTVRAPEFAIRGNGIEFLGAFRPAWRSDSSRVSVRDGSCIINTLPPEPRPGQYVFEPLFRPNPMGACAWDWGPTSALANQVLYTENSSAPSAVYRAREGSAPPGTRVLVYSDLPFQILDDLRWLPDGSGMVFLQTAPARDSANLYRLDFATGRAVPITRFSGEFVRSFSLSPDGRQIVFERSRSLSGEAPAELWIAQLDGSNARLLVKDAILPSWGRAAGR